MAKPRIPTEIDQREIGRQSRLGHTFEDVETDKAGVRATRRVSQHPLELLYTRNAITKQQFDAGTQFRKFYEAADGYASAMNFDGIPAPESFSAKALAEHKMQASISVGWLRRQMDATDFALVENVAGKGQMETFATDRDRVKYIGVIAHVLDKVARLYGLK